MIFSFQDNVIATLRPGETIKIYLNSLLLLFIAFNVVVAPNIVSDTIILTFEDLVCGVLSFSQTVR